MTFEEKRGPIKGRKIAWSGDYNNVLSSWIDASARFDFTLDIACPRELQPSQRRIEAARAAGAQIVLRENPEEFRQGRRRGASQTAGCRWATRTRAGATICCGPIR